MSNAPAQWDLFALMGRPLPDEDAEVERILRDPALSPDIRVLLTAAFTIARSVDAAAALSAGLPMGCSLFGYAHALLTDTAARDLADEVLAGVEAGRLHGHPDLQRSYKLLFADTAAAPGRP